MGAAVVTSRIIGLKISAQPILIGRKEIPTMLFFQGTDNKLWRMNPDGSGGVNPGGYKTKSTPIVCGTYVYFQGTDDRLWRINLDGGGGINLGGYKTNSPPFVNVNYLYFQGVDNKLWRINLDGSNGVNLGGYQTAASPCAAFGYIFFRGTDNKLWRINLDGGGGINLGLYQTKSSPFTDSQHVYFRGTDDKLWRINPDGTGGVNLGGYKTSSMPYVTPQHVCFQGADNKLWRINLDGSGGVNLGGYKTKSSPVVDSSMNLVYFQGTDNALWRINLDGSHGVHLGGFNTASTPFVIQPANQPQTTSGRLPYILLTVVYAPPGTNGGKSTSKVVYGSGSTTGTTSSISQSFKSNITVSVGFTSDPDAKDAPGAGSFGFGASKQTKDTSSVEIKKTNTYQVSVTGPAADGINHDEDLFYLWLNPEMIVNVDPWHDVSWTLGVNGPSMVVQSVYAGWLKNPASMPPGVLNDLQKAGLTATDFANILGTNPFAAGSTTIDTNRFLPTTQSFPYHPPLNAADTAPTSGYTQTASVTQTTTHEVSVTYSLSTGIDIKIPHTDINLLKVGASLEWTNTATQGTTSGSNQSADVTVGGPAFGYNGSTDDVLVYWDTIFNSFMFAFATEPATVTGSLRDASGQPVAHQEITLASGPHTYRTLTDASGSFRFYRSGPGTISIRGQNFNVSAGGPANPNHLQLAATMTGS